MNKAHLTAIARKKPSAPMKWLFDNYGPMFANRHCLDFGCGRGFDADHYTLDRYDPHYFPDVAVLTNSYDWVFCNYVLNVIQYKDEQDVVIKQICSLLKDGGGAFITVRRDCQLGKTSKGTWQSPIVFLDTTSFRKTSQFETYFLTRDYAKHMR